MTAFGQIVVGPAGAGKSSYCAQVQEYLASCHGRTSRIVNLDPGADLLTYKTCHADIREIAEIDEVMKEFNLGPNGALMKCMHHLSEHLEWFDDVIATDSDEYYIFDCPGQIELYLHSDYMLRIVQHLTNTYDIRLAIVFLIDAQFTTDIIKFISSVLCALSCMINFELPHFNIITKTDKLDKGELEFLQNLICNIDVASVRQYLSKLPKQHQFLKSKHSDFILKLTEVLSFYDYVQFGLLSLKKSKMLHRILMRIDVVIQYFELKEPKEPLMGEEGSGDVAN